MKSREEITAKVMRALGPSTGNRHTFMFGEVLDILIDCRDQQAQIISLLSERHTRREKEKVCRICGGSGVVTEYEEVLLKGTTTVKPVKVPCSCQPANTN